MKRTARILWVGVLALGTLFSSSAKAVSLMGERHAAPPWNLGVSYDFTSPIGRAPASDLPRVVTPKPWSLLPASTRPQNEVYTGGYSVSDTYRGMPDRAYGLQIPFSTDFKLWFEHKRQ